MNISIKEFRQMMEEHMQELRQSQDDYNNMCDEKEAEIKHLELRLETAKESLIGFKDGVLGVLSSSDRMTRGELKEKVLEAYANLVDGLDGY